MRLGSQQRGVPERNLHLCMTEQYERCLMERGAAANNKPMCVGLMDGACAGRGGGKMLSSGICGTCCHVGGDDQACEYCIFSWLMYCTVAIVIYIFSNECST